jgi:HEPN domain-containing protein
MAAEVLLREKVNLDAMYLAGYAIECTLKALILEATPDASRAMTLKVITQGATMHRLEILLGKLRDLGKPIPLELARRLRKSTWSTTLRYRSGRTPTGHTRAFLKTAKAVYDWVEREMS